MPFVPQIILGSEHRSVVTKKHILLFHVQNARGYVISLLDCGLCICVEVCESCSVCDSAIGKAMLANIQRIQPISHIIHISGKLHLGSLLRNRLGRKASMGISGPEFLPLSPPLAPSPQTKMPPYLVAQSPVTPRSLKKLV